MRYAIIIALLAGLLSSCERDISPVQAEKFVKFYGSYLMDDAGEVEVLDNGGYAICGTVTTSESGRKMVLILTDKYGNMQSGFPRYYAEEGLEAGANSMVVLEGGTGGFLLSGFVERPVAGSQTVQKDIFVVRTSASGEELWQRSYGSRENEQILHSIEMIGPGFMLAGYQVKNGRSDILIMGVTEEGDSIRLGLNYNNPYAENATATYLINTGKDYMCVCTFDKTNDKGTDILILSFDNELSPLEKNLSGELDEFGRCIIEEAGNRYLVLGNRIGSSGNTEMVVHSVEKDGLFITNTELVATISESNADLIGKRMIETMDGRYAIVGTREVGGNSNIFLQFLSSGYTVEEQVSYGASGVQSGTDIDNVDDGGIVLLGTNSFGENSIISLIKTSETGDL
ncbi:MAG: hypothetical protein KAR16_03205 [Bacteroidales bacterium]|nr:hypothetical protein [Bacteroidales bacterium]